MHGYFTGSASHNYQIGKHSSHFQPPPGGFFFALNLSTFSRKPRARCASAALLVGGKYDRLGVVFLIVMICIGSFVFYGVRHGGEEKKTNDPYISLLNRGLSHNDVRFILGSILLESGIKEDDIRIYFAQHDQEFANKYNITNSNIKETKEIDIIIIQRIGAYEEQVRALLN